jgi:hypothetical protein
LRRRVLLSALLVPLLSLGARRSQAEAWVMITYDEFEQQKSVAHNEQPSVAQVGGPAILVERPDETRPIKAPLSIEIAFRPQGHSKIDIKSLKVLYGYGLFDIDITTRILDHAVLTESGLTADNAAIPAGHHRVTIEISDDMTPKRTGNRVIDFTVT